MWKGMHCRNVISACVTRTNLNMVMVCRNLKYRHFMQMTAAIFQHHNKYSQPQARSITAGILRNKSMIFMVFSKWSLALLWPEEAVYLLFNFPLDQSVCRSNNLLQSINILLLAISRSLLPRKIIQGFCAPLIGRHTALPHTHTPPLPGRCFCLILEQWAEVYPTL